MGTLEESGLNMLKEGKILTIRTVADEMGTDVRKARTIMENIVENNKNEHFSVTYYVSGILKNSEGIAASVVNESDLQKFRDKLEKVISEHIYAIHNTASEVDPTLLQVANENKGELCLGSITLENVARRKIQEIKEEEVEVKVPVQKKTASSAFSNFKPEAKKPVEQQESKKNDSMKPQIPSKNKSPVKEPKKNGIAGMFAKQSSLEATKKVKPSEEKQKKSIEETKTQTDSKESSSNSTKKIKLDKKSPVKTKKKETASKKSNKNNSKSDKFKRIVCEDSDDEKDDEEEDDIFESTSPKNRKRLLSDSDEDVIPATPQEPQKPVLNSRKRKKMVDRTFMKDGFFVTVKEEVFENCSDEEEVENKPENNIVNKPEKTNGKLTKSPQKTETVKSKKSPTVVKGKQSSLMSFFKKETK